MPRSLVKTHIRGFDFEVLGGGIPEGHVVLIRGSSGTMKSSLAYYVLYENALQGRGGLYLTLEQPAGNLLEHIAGLGLRATAVSDRLPILDLSRGREHLEGLVDRMGEIRPAARSAVDLAAVLKAKVLDLKARTGASLLAVDSWDALADLLEFEDRRGETFAFFRWFRETGLTSFLVTEAYPARPGHGFEEEFLADGVVNLSMERTSEVSFQRRIQCAKMRSAEHRADAYTLVYENDRFQVERAIG